MKLRLASAVLAFCVAGCFECENCQKSDKKESGSAAAPAAVAGSNVIALDVQKMVCEQGCASRVQQILAQYPGVDKATVDFPRKMAFITPEKGAQLDLDAVVKALADEGYPASIHSEG